ncbi:MULTISPECIES: OprD family outer membrane porin [unclassified Nitratiruptor]|uniref:OprD family outer membrane porin n=1 Tax=unclassified Nitratiruptor TaxID=2624044 RepID=UPI0018EC7ADA|nr:MULTISPECIES: OprD family outer membrane porin [unclassified Nitratiruptor]BCD61153.1 hypothetical protein NitYY0810_P15 [Nitratiruptor sp. YY08-10]BCD65086.1 hypothetical protein NitYY0814_P15 [Nitratiruptor sp. YY08-14]
MNKIILSAVAVLMMGNTIYADENIPSAKQNSFLKSIDGYIRVGYQFDDNSNQDLATGGKLHIQTKSFKGVSAGASFYTTNVVGHINDGAEGFGFFDANNKSYSILGEAYLLGEFGNTTIKVGRQEIDTPFADTDDIAMVPNTFEAALLINKDLPDTTIILAQVQRWAGVDAPNPSSFEDLNGDDGVQVASITYEGIEGLALSAWYYYLNDFAIDKIFYADANYEGEVNGVSYALGVQYAYQNYSASGVDSASIYGVSASAGYKGFTLGVAYNKSNDNAADNGFGGGPFFTSAEVLTLAEGGVDADAWYVNAELDLDTFGVEGLTFGAGYLNLTDTNNVDSTEFDGYISYAFNDNLSFNLIYSDVDDDINKDNFTNTRIFVNYSF